MTKASWFRLGALGFLGGVAICGFISVSWFAVYILGLASVVILILFRNIPAGVTVGVVVLFGVFGLVRYAVSEPRITERFIGSYNGAVVELTGKIAANPDVRDNHQKLILSNVSVGDSGRMLQGRLLVLTTLLHQYHYSDELLLVCSLENPRPIDDFAYDKYLARFYVYSICPFPETIEVIRPAPHTLLGGLLTIKEVFKKRVNENISEPAASLLNGLLLGEKKGLGETLTESFRRVGLSHLVALSGYNIAVLVGMLVVLGRYLYIPRRILFVIITVMIVLFVLTTGSSPSVIRAGFMGWLVLLAYELGRLAKPFNLLLFAAALMVVINPKILLWDVGWQLSFLATFALLYLAPILQEIFRRLPNPLALKEIFIMSVSAIIFTAPLTMWQFGGWSLVAPLANILVLPVIPIIMALGLITGILGNFTLFSFLWLWPSWLLLTYVIWVSEWLATFKWSLIMIPHFPSYLMVVSYAVLFILVHFLKKKTYTYDHKRA